MSIRANSKAYTIQIDDLQLAIIHEALKQDVPRSEHHKELKSLIAFSNPNNPDYPLVEFPGLNGWTL